MEMGKQMTVDKTGAPGDITKGWRAIDWQKARREVRRLPHRFASATSLRAPERAISIAISIWKEVFRNITAAGIQHYRATSNVVRT